MTQTLEIRKPDDWHVHCRDSLYLSQTVPATAQHFRRALIMPNLKPALTSLDLLLAYCERIKAAIPQKNSFTPYMTLYLNEHVDPECIVRAGKHTEVLGAKLYPAGATTNAEQGVKSFKSLYPLLDLMQAQDLVLQIHGETTQGDIFDRETLFLTEVLKPLMHNFPKLRIVLEHISTQAAVHFVSEAPATLAATITPHHLLFNRNHMLAGGIHPHYYCLPILKCEQDQRALITAATNGNPKFFAGTDSAPHAKETKENACGCAGIYSAPYAVALYAQIFENQKRLDRLENFMSQFGADFYHLPYNHETIVLKKQSHQIPLELPFGDSVVVPILSGTHIEWSIDEF